MKPPNSINKVIVFFAIFFFIFCLKISAKIGDKYYFISKEVKNSQYLQQSIFLSTSKTIVFTLIEEGFMCQKINLILNIDTNQK